MWFHKWQFDLFALLWNINLELQKNVSVDIWYAHTYFSQSHTNIHTNTRVYTPLFSVLVAFLYPAQCWQGALSLIAFPSPLIILMVFHATQWASACLHHIKITLSPGRTLGAPSSCHVCSPVRSFYTIETMIEHCYCHFTSGSDNYNPIVMKSSNPASSSSLICKDKLMY